MKKQFILFLLVVFVFSFTSNVIASDWDKAGIALTGIEGLRILTGGKVDLIGSMFGMNNQHKHKHYAKHGKKHYHFHNASPSCYEKEVWIPHYDWRRKYIPEHKSYDPKYGKVIVEGHYIKYKIEDGGHWESQYYCS